MKKTTADVISGEGKEQTMKDSRAATLIFIGLFWSAASLRAGSPEKASPLAVVTQSLPSGYVRLAVENQSPTRITALVAIGKRTKISDKRTMTSVRFFDYLLNPFGSKPIEPGQNFYFTFFGPNPPPSTLHTSVEIKAAVFSDGTTWGDPVWVNTLLLRRSAATHFQTEALQIIDAGISAKADRRRLIQDLTDEKNTELRTSRTVAERQMADFAFAEPIMLIGHTSRPNGQPMSDSESISNARLRLNWRLKQLSGASISEMPLSLKGKLIRPRTPR